MATRDPIVGIDLGTTNSLVAVAGWGKDVAPRVIADEQGRGGAMLPSVVRFNEDGTTTIGHEAREQAVMYPLTTVSSVKRLMGRSVADAAADLGYLSFRVVEGANRTARIEIPVKGFSDAKAPPSPRPPPSGRGSRTISPQEVSAIILRALKERASRELGVEVRRAVVTVPAYFDDAQRQATRDAGRLAGLEVVRIVNEPTAAALAYGLGSRGNQTVVVYDLGGGTFDVSVLRLTQSTGGQATSGTPSTTDFFQVLATSGDTHLGGDDFDHALVGLFTREISERWFGGADLVLPPETRQALVRFAEGAKIRLSEVEEARVRIDLGEEAKGENQPTPRPHPTGRGSRTYERTVTRTEFEALVAPLVERTIESCRRAMRDAKRQMEGDPIGAVVLVGGATRMPLVRRRVAEMFGMTPYTALDPDLVVALGAAVQGGVLMELERARTTQDENQPSPQPPPTGRGSRSLLLDVVPLSLGIETVGGAMAKLVMRNSTVPTRAHEMFSTSVDGQSSIKINVLQGEREMAADCRSLGEFHLRGIPPMPAGIPKLRVEFFVDANGILNVSAEEQRSGKRLDVQIVPNHGLTREEVERIERESLANAREDMTRHRVVDLVANSRLDVRWIEKALERVEGDVGCGMADGGLGEGLERGYVEGLKAQIANLKSQISEAERDWRSVDADAFHLAKERLDRASVRLHEVAIAMSLREKA